MKEIEEDCDLHLLAFLDMVNDKWRQSKWRDYNTIMDGIKDYTKCCGVRAEWFFRQNENQSCWEISLKNTKSF